MAGVDCSFRIGKCHVNVSHDGCVVCGTRWSSGWHPAGVFEVAVGKKRGEITVSMCDDCKKAGKTWNGR